MSVQNETPVYDAIVWAMDPMTYVNNARYYFCTVPYSKIQSAIRDILFPGPESRFDAEEIQACRDINTGRSSTISFNTTHYAQNCITETKTFEILLNGEKISTEVLVMRTNFNNAPMHRVLRFGGNIENIAIGSAANIPFFNSFIEQTNQARNLEIIQPSLYDMKKDGAPWKPATAKELSDVYFEIHKAVNAQMGEVKSWLCFSMGSLALEGLEERDRNMVPKNIIIHNGCPSIWGVGRQTQGMFVSRILWSAAWLTGWDVWPQERVAKHIARNIGEKTCINVRVKHDEYFSNYGRWPTLKGNRVVDITFPMNRISQHERSHHAAPPTDLIYTDETVSAGSFRIAKHQSFAEALATSVFSS